jgi:hypothetical protein
MNLHATSLSGKSNDKGHARGLCKLCAVSTVVSVWAGCWPWCRDTKIALQDHAGYCSPHSSSEKGYYTVRKCGEHFALVHVGLLEDGADEGFEPELQLYMQCLPSHQLPSVLEKKIHRAWGRGRQPPAREILNTLNQKWVIQLGVLYVVSYLSRI